MFISHGCLGCERHAKAYSESTQSDATDLGLSMWQEALRCTPRCVCARLQNQEARMARIGGDRRGLSATSTQARYRPHHRRFAPFRRPSVGSSLPDRPAFHRWLTNHGYGAPPMEEAVGQRSVGAHFSPLCIGQCAAVDCFPPFLEHRRQRVSGISSMFISYGGWGCERHAKVHSACA